MYEQYLKADGDSSLNPHVIHKRGAVQAMAMRTSHNLRTQ